MALRAAWASGGACAFRCVKAEVAKETAHRAVVGEGGAVVCNPHRTPTAQSVLRSDAGVFS